LLTQGAGPVEVAVIRAGEEAFDAWAGGTLDFAFDAVEDNVGVFVFLQFAYQRSELSVKDLRNVRSCDFSKLNYC